MVCVCKWHAQEGHYYYYKFLVHFFRTATIVTSTSPHQLTTSIAAAQPVFLFPSVHIFCCVLFTFTVAVSVSFQMDLLNGFYVGSHQCPSKSVYHLQTNNSKLYTYKPFLYYSFGMNEQAFTTLSHPHKNTSMKYSQHKTHMLTYLFAE